MAATDSGGPPAGPDTPAGEAEDEGRSAIVKTCGSIADAGEGTLAGELIAGSTVASRSLVGGIEAGKDEFQRSGLGSAGEGEVVLAPGIDDAGWVEPTVEAEEAWVPLDPDGAWRHRGCSRPTGSPRRNLRTAAALRRRGRTTTGRTCPPTGPEPGWPRPWPPIRPKPQGLARGVVSGRVRVRPTPSGFVAGRRRAGPIGRGDDLRSGRDGGAVAALQPGSAGRDGASAGRLAWLDAGLGRPAASLVRRFPAWSSEAPRDCRPAARRPRRRTGGHGP